MIDLVKERNIKGGKALWKVKGGYNVEDYYRHYRKNGGALLRYPFSLVLRECNLALTEELLENAEEYTLPCNIGKISFRKRKNKAVITKNGIRSVVLPDWKRTMALWQKDDQSRRNKVLVRYSNMNTGRYSFRILLLRRFFKNKDFFEFRFQRSFKRKFKDRILTYNKPKIEAQITKTI